MNIPIPLQEALKDSITSGTFVDTKFWVYSKRGSKPGRVGEPKALFVNGRVAKHVPRLGSLLDGRGTKEDLRARFPADRKAYTNDYGYEDDSDLEEDDGLDDDEDDFLDDKPAASPSDDVDEPVFAIQAAVEELGDKFDDVVSIGSSDAKSTEPLDTISVSDLDPLSSVSSDVKDEADTAPFCHVGKVVVIEDVAFVTFQALLRYLYTNDIEFAPWGSTERRRARTLEKIPESYGIPKPSPKSIYRLADKYDIPELKELALRQIQQDLIKCDITDELFSKYTSWYPELRELELRQLTRVLLSSDSGPALEALKTKIRRYASGELSHAEHVLPALYEFMESNISVEEPPLPPAATSNRQVTDGNWDRLKRALTGSLTSGTFIDSQFYAVESKPSTGSPTIRPIYFCSRVGGDFPSRLAVYCSKLGARRTLLPQCSDGYDSDIGDAKLDRESFTECCPRSKCVRENPIPASSLTEPALLLRSGTAKTWGAIFLWVYTGQITFATIHSQGALSSESKEAQDGSSSDERSSLRDPGGSREPLVAVIAAPCSPKSIYHLANKVGLTGLCDIAFKDIQSKLNKCNIVQELFSTFTADHKHIRDMEHELFQSKLKPSVDAALLSEAVRSSSSGEHPHRAAIMELIFERAIRERHERMLTRMEKTLGSDPVPQPEGNKDMPNIMIPQVQSPTPAPQPQSHLPPNSAGTGVPTRFVSASLESEASLGPSPLSRPAKKKGLRHAEPPTDAEVNSPLKDTVELACRSCDTKRLRKHLSLGIFCNPCLAAMVCVGCGTLRARDIGACTGCNKKFK